MSQCDPTVTGSDRKPLEQQLLELRTLETVLWFRQVWSDLTCWWTDNEEKHWTNCVGLRSQSSFCGFTKNIHFNLWHAMVVTLGRGEGPTRLSSEIPNSVWNSWEFQGKVGFTSSDGHECVAEMMITSHNHPRYMRSPTSSQPGWRSQGLWLVHQVCWSITIMLSSTFFITDMLVSVCTRRHESRIPQSIASFYESAVWLNRDLNGWGLQSTTPHTNISIRVVTEEEKPEAQKHENSWWQTCSSECFSWFFSYKTFMFT